MSSTNHKNKLAHEEYPTPAALVQALMAQINWERIERNAQMRGRKPRFLEPCRGTERRIYDAVPDICEKFHCEIQEGSDYLTTDCGRGLFDVIITNPPFTLFEAFLEKSLREVSTDGLVIYLLRVNALGSKKRSDFWGGTVPWPNKQIVTVPRPDFSGAGGDSCEYAFFCWDPCHYLEDFGPLGRLNWVKPKKVRAKRVKKAEAV